MRVRTFIILPLFACCTALSMASAVSKPIVLSLKDAIFLGLRKNPTIENTELDRITQKYAVIVAKNMFEPQYALTGNLDYTQTTADNVNSSSNNYGLTPQVSLKSHYGTKLTATSYNPVLKQAYNPSLVFKIEQPLIKGFGKAITDKTLNDALDTEEANRLALKNTLISTINSIINNYLSLLQQKETLKVDIESLNRYIENVKNDEIRIKAGRMAPADIEQDRAQVASQKVTVQNDINAIETSRLILLSTLGLDPTANITIPDQPDLKEIIAILTGGKTLPPVETCLQAALTNDATFQTLGIQLRSLRRAVLKAKDDMRWTLNLTASETTGGGSGGGNNSGLTSLVNQRNHSEKVGFDLSIPIDNVSLKQSLLNAQIALDKSENLYHYGKQTLESNVINARNLLISSKKELALSEDALELQRKTVDFARIKFNAGRISNFELLDKQKTLTAANQNVVNNLITYLNAIASFDQTLGITLDLLGIKIKDSAVRNISSHSETFND